MVSAIVTATAANRPWRRALGLVALVQRRGMVSQVSTAVVHVETVDLARQIFISGHLRGHRWTEYVWLFYLDQPYYMCILTGAPPG